MNRFYEKCPGCGTEIGKQHKNCDVERCSKCGDQRFSCGCSGHDSKFARWTGFWPGSLESAALGIDLNTFYVKGYNKKLFVKP